MYALACILLLIYADVEGEGVTRWGLLRPFEESFEENPLKTCPIAASVIAARIALSVGVTKRAVPVQIVFPPG